MFEFIKHYASALQIGYRSALSKLLGDPGLVEDTDPSVFSEPTFTTVNSASSYNDALRQISTNLHALYAESTNLQIMDKRSEDLGTSDVLRLRAAIEDLEARTRSTIQLSPIRHSFTDTYVETFNSQTKSEEDPKFYQNGTIPKALIDVNDGKLKLPVDGEFLNVLSEVGEVPSTVFLDRVIGTPISVDNEANCAFDRTVSNYWEEALLVSEPIYASSYNYPWLPPTYSGGAVCRLRVDFERTTQISELDIRPFGQHPQKFIGLGYTCELQNKLSDASFSSWWGNDSTPTWAITTLSYGSTGTASGSVEGGIGPEGQTGVHLYTYSPTGSCYVIHDIFEVSGAGTVEVSVLLKTLGNVPVEICATFFTSGSSGGTTLYTSLKDVIETVRIDSLGWTRVITALDMPVNTTHAKIRIGLPPNMSRASNIWICDPRVEPVRSIYFNEYLESRSTIFLPTPILAKRLYLILSQEHYEFKTYNIDSSAESPWFRLLRKRYMSPDILSWDRKLHREASIVLPAAPTLTTFKPYEVMRPLEGTSHYLIDSLEKLASKETTLTINGYEYILGAFEIYLKHREYAARGRYVTPPIKIGGEIRELKLQSIDETISPDNIQYRLTVNEKDTPEHGKILSNSLTVYQDMHSYPLPPSTLDYLPTATSFWTGSDKFTPVPLSGVVLSNGVGVTGRYDEYAWFRINGSVQKGTYVEYRLPAEVDLSGASHVTIEFCSICPSDINAPITFKFGISESQTESAFIYSEAATYPAGLIAEDNKLQTYTTKINLTTASVENRDGINYIRIMVVYDAAGRVPVNFTRYLAVRKVRCVAAGEASSAIRFIPADESSEVSASVVTDFIVPVKQIKELISGTDRYGRAKLTEYPYLNRTRVASLITTLSSNTGGRLIPFDPNAENPKYLSSASTMDTTTGYRPILVSLLFQDGTRVGPDVLGKPDPGDIGRVEDEILELASVSQTSHVTSEQTDKIDSKVKTTGTQTVYDRNILTYQTKFRPIVLEKYGIPIQCKWFKKDVTGVTGTDGGVIDPAYIKVDAKNGLIEINAPKIDASGNLDEEYKNVKCTYFYVMNEYSLREPFLYPDMAAMTYSILTNTVQTYPITRNMTDYMYGKLPELRVPQLDPMDPNYYPVYEYYVHPDGYLVFSQNLHKYSDTPAEIEVEYATLGISPRLCIDLTRPDNTSQTPRVDRFSILMNVRRG